MMHEQENCRLCNTLSPMFHITNDRYYFKCPNCGGIFLSQLFLPNEARELDRYEAHNNNVRDTHYRQFVSPITEAIIAYFNKQHIGLDFGAGPGPVITTVLRENGYQVESYDPFFDNRPEVLNIAYNYIACCEVAEHFHQPYLEFEQLKSLLKPGGKLFIMTDLYKEKINFDNWYYKDDLTHVFFYQKQTFKWIQDSLEFHDLEIKGRLITFSKSSNS